MSRIPSFRLVQDGTASSRLGSSGRPNTHAPVSAQVWSVSSTSCGRSRWSLCLPTTEDSSGDDARAWRRSPAAVPDLRFARQPSAAGLARSTASIRWEHRRRRTEARDMVGPSTSGLRRLHLAPSTSRRSASRCLSVRMQMASRPAAHGVPQRRHSRRPVSSMKGRLMSRCAPRWLTFGCWFGGFEAVGAGIIGIPRLCLGLVAISPGEAGRVKRGGSRLWVDGAGWGALDVAG